MLAAIFRELYVNKTVEQKISLPSVKKNISNKDSKSES